MMPVTASAQALVTGVQVDVVPAMAMPRWKSAHEASASSSLNSFLIFDFQPIVDGHLPYQPRVTVLTTPDGLCCSECVGTLVNVSLCKCIL